MMSYEEFEREVEKQFKDIYYELTQGNELMPKKEECLFDRESKINPQPVIYLYEYYNKASTDFSTVLKNYVIKAMDIMYKSYKVSENFPAVLKDNVRKLLDIMDKVITPVTRESIEENICFQLIHTKENKEILVNTPHRTFLDLTIVYQWDVKINDKEVSNVMINNDFAETFEFTEDELYRAAFKNTKRLFPSLVKEWIDHPGTYVISNHYGFCGASAILYSENLEKIAEKLQSDLYLLSTSIHDWVVWSTKNNTIETLADIVYDANIKIMPKDYLSGSVYRYDRETKKISIVYESIAYKKENIL